MPHLLHLLLLAILRKLCETICLCRKWQLAYDEDICHALFEPPLSNSSDRNFESPSLLITSLQLIPCKPSFSSHMMVLFLLWIHFYLRFSLHVLSTRSLSRPLKPLIEYAYENGAYLNDMKYWCQVVLRQYNLHLVPHLQSEHPVLFEVPRLTIGASFWYAS